MKALIIDDEPSAIATLSLMIERYTPEVSELKTTTDPAEGVFLLRSWQPRVLFLDIQMPAMNGFDVLRQFPEIPFHIVFTTAYDQYAIHAIRFSALDYLLKPIDADELRSAMDRVVAQESSLQAREQLYSNLLHNLNARTKADFKLTVATTSGHYFYAPQDIIRLEAESNYTRFYFVNQRPILTSRTLKEYEEILVDHGFIRTHKSHLVNVRHVSSFAREGFLTMADGSTVDVSRRRKEEVAEQLRLR